MKTASSDRLVAQQRAEIAALRGLPEEEIDIVDVPEQRNWKGAQRGLFFRPIKRQITLRLDADVIEWFRLHPKPAAGYQTSINQALREYVAQYATSIETPRKVTGAQVAQLARRSLPKGESRQESRHTSGATRKTQFLFLTLHREFFDAIAVGTKKTEYRDDKPYWRSRLEGRTYAEVVFRNGYAANAPMLRVQCLGIRRDKRKRFAIRLGQILEMKNYHRKLIRQPNRAPAVGSR